MAGAVRHPQEFCGFRHRLSIWSVPVRLRYGTEEGDAVEFLLLFNERKGTPPPEAEGRAAMTKYSGELRSRGVLRRGGPLAPASAGAGVRVREGKAFVTDGPFAETKDAIGGYSLVRATGRAAAIELAKRYPHARWGPVEVREILFLDPV